MNWKSLYFQHKEENNEEDLIYSSRRIHGNISCCMFFRQYIHIHFHWWRRKVRHESRNGYGLRWHYWPVLQPDNLWSLQGLGIRKRCWIQLFQACNKRRCWPCSFHWRSNRTGLQRYRYARLCICTSNCRSCTWLWRCQVRRAGRIAVWPWHCFRNDWLEVW